MDITLLARGERLKTLRKKDLLYDDKGVIRSVKVRLIDRLEANDIYDYILVAVRYDQIEGGAGCGATQSKPKYRDPDNHVSRLRQLAGHCR